MTTALQNHNPLTKSIFNYKVVILVLFAMLMVIATVLITYTTYATSGNELEDMDKQKKSLIQENTDLSLKIANSTALPQIQQKAKDLGFVKNDQTIIIKEK